MVILCVDFERVFLSSLQRGLLGKRRVAERPITALPVGAACPAPPRVDIVLNHRLTESGFGSKKDYTVYLKDYMKKIVTYLESNGRTDEVDTFKKNINGYMKDVLGRFKDLQFFVGE